jgi:hypothetical protein
LEAFDISETAKFDKEKDENPEPDLKPTTMFLTSHVICTQLKNLNLMEIMVF